MGGTLVAVSTNTAGVIDCTKDSDCFAANAKNGGTQPAATTVADKAERCCMMYQLMKKPNTTSGTTLITKYKTDYGLDLKEGSFTKACNYNYPTQIAFAKQQNYNVMTGEYTANSSVGSYVLKEYCAGGAVALAATAATTAALAVSMY